MHTVIIGGGIAGPVTAMALQQAGIAATIVEAHPSSGADVGSWFTISPNGLDALRAVGAEQLALEAGFPTRRTFLYSHDGRRLGTPTLGRDTVGTLPAHTLRRSRLSRALLDEAAVRGATVEHGRRLVGATTAPDGSVTARFDDGSELTADLLVGADGIHSVTRRLIDPAAPDGRYVGLTNFGGITRGGRPPVAPGDWHMIFGRRAFFGYQATPDGDTVWYVNWPRPEIGREERRSIGAEEWQARLAALFSHDVGPAVDLIEAGELELAADNIFDLPHVPTWHRGRLVIVGDAAHAPSPTSGQGASMAAEDGVLLAKALRDLPSIPEALRAFEGVRRHRVERIVAYGARGSSSKVPGPLWRHAQKAVLPLVFRLLVTDRSTEWIYGHRVEWDSPLTTGHAPVSAQPGRPPRA